MINQIIPLLYAEQIFEEENEHLNLIKFKRIKTMFTNCLVNIFQNAQCITIDTLSIDDEILPTFLTKFNKLKSLHIISNELDFYHFGDTKLQLENFIIDAKNNTNYANDIINDILKE